MWQSILSNVSQIEDSTDFFKSGAASMDVVRWYREKYKTMSIFFLLFITYVTYSSSLCLFRYGVEQILIH